MVTAGRHNGWIPMVGVLKMRRPKSPCGSIFLASNSKLRFYLSWTTILYLEYYFIIGIDYGTISKSRFDLRIYRQFTLRFHLSPIFQKRYSLCQDKSRSNPFPELPFSERGPYLPTAELWKNIRLLILRLYD
jgi:hypothetical protein